MGCDRGGRERVGRDGGGVGNNTLEYFPPGSRTSVAILDYLPSASRTGTRNCALTPERSWKRIIRKQLRVLKRAKSEQIKRDLKKTLLI